MSTSAVFSPAAAEKIEQLFRAQVDLELSSRRRYSLLTEQGLFRCRKYLFAHTDVVMTWSDNVDMVVDRLIAERAS